MVNQTFEFGFRVDQEPGKTLGVITSIQETEFLFQINCNEFLLYESLPNLYFSNIRYWWRPDAEGNDAPATDALRTRELGYGKCVSLVAYRKAELYVRHRTVTTIEAMPQTMPNGTLRTHIFLRFQNGQTEDPSDRLGMVDF